MTLRELPLDEWPRLSACQFGDLWQGLKPEDTTVLVIEQDGEIVAHWCLLRIYHVEGLWIRHDYRQRLSVARRLWLGMRALAAGMGARAVMTGADTDEIRAMLTRVGATKLPFDSYVLPIQEPPCH